MQPTLLLNATYEPLRVIDWKRAMTLLVLDKVEALAHYDRRIRSARQAHPLPAVVRLRRRVPWRQSRVPFSRRNLMIRDKFTCQYCGGQPQKSKLTLDHVMPRSQGGPTSWTNVVAACLSCNQVKGGRTPIQASMTLRSSPLAPRWLNVRGGPATPSPLWEPFLW